MRIRKEVHRVQLNEELRRRVIALRSQELPHAIIGQRLGISRTTIRKLLASAQR
jgi:DNA-binding transcriptional regulator LsrR (DeoR family)